MVVLLLILGHWNIVQICPAVICAVCQQWHESLLVQWHESLATQWLRPVMSHPALFSGCLTQHRRTVSHTSLRFFTWSRMVLIPAWFLYVILCIRSHWFRHSEVCSLAWNERLGADVYTGSTGASATDTAVWQCFIHFWNDINMGNFQDKSWVFFFLDGFSSFWIV